MATVATNQNHNFLLLLCIYILMHLDYVFVTCATSIARKAGVDDINTSRLAQNVLLYSTEQHDLNTDEPRQHGQSNISTNVHSNNSLVAAFQRPVNETFNFRAYRVSKDGTVGAIVLLLLFAVIFGSVYFTRMWKHRDDFYSDGDDVTFLSTYSSPRAINRNIKSIKEILKTRLKYLSTNGKRKAQKFLNWNRRKRKGLEKYVDDDDDILFNRALLNNDQEY